MTVYVDILILVNFIVDYFLLLLSSRFLQKKPRLWRLITGAATGGFFSLYIFLPQSSLFFQIVIQIFMCAVLCLITFGLNNLKSFLRSVAVLFIVNYAYSGAMIAIWLLFKPYGMVINNSVVYFNISPLFLIFFSVIAYFTVALLRKFLRHKFIQQTYCTVCLQCKDNNLTLKGIADTGNSLTDVFGISQIFIAEEHTVEMLMQSEKFNPARYRKIPCVTVTGEMLLDGYRIDSASVIFNNREYSFKKPIIAVSQTRLDDCDVIINPENLN